MPQPGTTSRSGQTSTGARKGTSHAIARTPITATLAYAARRAGLLIGCGSYDAALDWPPMWPATSRTAPLLALGIGGVVTVVALAVMVSIDLTDAFDGRIITAVRAAALHDLLAPLGVITELGSTLAVVVVALLTFAVGAAIGPWRHGAAGALTIGLASVANSALKTLIARARPDLLDPIVEERGFSFPSGHSALGMVAYGVLAVLISRSRLPPGVRRTVIAALAVLIALIGLSRIWLGVHYPTDVLAGWAAGGVIVLAYAGLTRRVSPEPAEGAADADQGAQRSGRPAPG
jgi:undecaprenyl-diphosphatase